MDAHESAVVDRIVRLDFELDLVLTLGPLQHGRRDPTIRFEAGTVWRATRTPDGPATIRIARAHDGWRVTAWGPGAQAAAERVPRLLGSEDQPERLEVPEGRLRDIVARARGLRFGRSDAVMEALLPAIIGQKVTSIEAQRAYRRLIARFGEAAPGPGGLRLGPEPADLGTLPYYELHPLGLEQRRAVTLIRAAQQAPQLEAAASMTPGAALARLRSVPGVGAWTAAETARTAFGDPDVVSLGDFHIPNTICWALAGEPRGDDARMLELLEPYRGQRGRLIRLIKLSGITAPKYGPRSPIRSIDEI